MGRRAEKISPLEISQLEISPLEIAQVEIAQVEISPPEIAQLSELAAELARGARSGELEIEIAAQIARRSEEIARRSEEIARRSEEIGPVGASALGWGAEAAAHLGGVISREHEGAAGRRRRIGARSAGLGYARVRYTRPKS